LKKLVLNNYNFYLMQSKFSFIDLFSGIGGFHSGLASLGGECVFASDILPVACATYELNYGIKPFGDITKIDAKDIPSHDVLCAGFPCQSFSNVGQKGGLNDPRGEMIYEIFRILKAKKPKAFILENVKGLQSHDQGRVLKFIVETLTSLGYNVKHEVLEAKDYGLPQIRKRLFFVGIRNTVKKEFTFPAPVELQYTLNDVMKGNAEREFGFTVRIGGRRSGINNRFNWDAYRVDGKERIITPEECLLLQGFKPDFKLVGNESQRYYQAGNSVPVSIIHEIGKQLIKIKVL
jgi:DNA (cytosine-5)-methyltransferase 1